MNLVNPSNYSDYKQKWNVRTKKARAALPIRADYYWHLLRPGKALGIRKFKDGTIKWYARIKLSPYKYKRKFLSIAERDNKTVTTFRVASLLADEWFNSPSIRKIAPTDKRLGMGLGLTYSPIGNIYTLGHALTDYMKWRQYAFARNTYTGNVCHINAYIVGPILNLPLDEYKTTHLRKLLIEVLERVPVRERAGRKVEKRSIESLDIDQLRKRKKIFNALVSILRGAIKMAWENKYIDSPRAFTRLKRVPNVDYPRIIYLQRDECERLVDCCRSDLRDFVLASLYTGCRAGELAKIRVRDVAHHSYGIYIEPQKSRHPRHVFLPDEGMAFFLKMIEGKSFDDLVFKTHQGTSWNKEVYRVPFRNAVKKAGLPEEFVFHGLRHTYASQLVQSGVPLLIVSQQLGHATVETVCRTYGHMAPQIRESQIRTHFAPLSRPFAQEVVERKDQLENLLSKLQRHSVRAYAQVRHETHWPTKNRSDCGKDLLSVFEEHRPGDCWFGKTR